MTSPLLIRFGDQAVTLHCDDPDLAAFLADMFPHSLNGRFPSRTTLHISAATDGQYILHRDREILQTSATAAALLPWLMQELVSALIEAQTQHLIFHAGGVVLNQKGVFLGGQTGSGKSTLTTCLLANGARYLSDEVLALTPGNPPQMTGFLRPLVLKEALPPTWAPQKLALFPLAVMPDGSRWISPAWMGADVAVNPVTVHQLLFPTFQANAQLAIRPLTPAEAAFYLLQNLVNARNLPDKGVSDTARIARRVPAYRITYNDATAVAAWLHDQVFHP